MGQIPQAFIEDLVSRLDILDIIGSRIKLRRAGASWVGCCPFHTEKTPSFNVSPRKQLYHCFGCGASGDVIRFISEYEGLHFVEAVQNLSEHLGLELPQNSEPVLSSQHQGLYALLLEAKAFYEQQLRVHALAPHVHDYLKKRGLTGKTIKHFSVGFAPPAWDALVQCLGTSPERLNDLLRVGLVIKKTSGGFYDRFRDRLIFPIHDRRGRVIGFGGRVFESKQQPKYLNSPETPVFSKGKALYGIYEARLHRPFHRLLVVEGYMDVLSLQQFGISEVVASLGTALSEAQIDYLFQQSPELIFCFDGDSAGQAAAERALRLILPQMKEGRRARFVLLPDGTDPDSFIQQRGLPEFLEKIDKAYSLSDFLFEGLIRKLDLSHLENRAALVNAARPLIQRLPGGVLQQMLYQRLAELAQIEIAHLIPKRLPIIKQTAKTVKQSKRLLTLAHRAVGLLLRERGLIERIPKTLIFTGSEVDSGIALLYAIIEILRVQPEASFEFILQQLPNALKSQFSTENWDLLVELTPVQGAEKELLGALQRLQEQAEEQAIEEILSKSKGSSLSVEEKQQLSDYFIRRDKSRVD